MPWHEAPTGTAASRSHDGPTSITPVPDVPVPDAEPHYGLVWGDDLVTPEAAS
jgi:hypothetical protein